MTAGNQGKALDKARENLARDPNNKTLKTAVAVRTEEYNASMRRSGQKEIR